MGFQSMHKIQQDHLQTLFHLIVLILNVLLFALNKHHLNLSSSCFHCAPSFSGEVVQGHDAAGPDERTPHGVVRKQARPHPQGRRRDRFWQLLVHSRQQVLITRFGHDLCEIIYVLPHFH